MSAVRRGSAAKAARVALQSRECMLHPGLANLFKAIIVGRSTAHSIKILRNDRMVVARQRKPIQLNGSVIAGGCSNRQADLGSGASKLRHGRQISHDDIRSGNESRNTWSC